MSHTPFTPGPWKVRTILDQVLNVIEGSEDVQTHGWEVRISDVGNASYSDKVCEVYGDMNLPAPMANARLIAAAPLLLEACQELVNDLSERIAGGERFNPGTMNAIEQAKSALAAARGLETK